MLPIFFIHIPKTAGTSFREAAVQYFSDEEIFCDYGPNAEPTSDLLKKSGNQSDWWAVQKEILSTQPVMIAGHVPAMKYAPMLSARSLLTIIRDPLEQAVSHYSHFIRHNGYTGTFSDFMNEPRFTNNQSRYVRGVPIEAYCLLGTTDRYSLFIDQFNGLFGANLQSLQLNTSNEPEFSVETVSDHDRKLFFDRNSHDMDLYRRISANVTAREAFAYDIQRWTHGAIVNYEDGIVTGWAWRSADDSPVEVECGVNGKIAATMEATEFRPQLRAFNAPRDGYVGFRFNLHDVLPGDIVTCLVADTGQPIGSRTCPEH